MGTEDIGIKGLNLDLESFGIDPTTLRDFKRRGAKSRVSNMRIQATPEGAPDS
jgi:hypothetical protein